MEPSLLAIFLDYQCNLACKHCSVGSNPHLKFPMTRDILERGVSEFADLPSSRVVVFTGGEATLRWDELLHGLSLAKSRGLVTRLVSNAWWAKSLQDARSKLADLKAAGLDEFNTSYDLYHAEFLPIDRVLNALQAAIEMGFAGRIAMSVILDEEQSWSADAIRRQLSLRLGTSPEQLSGQVKIIEDLPIPAGSGEELGVWTDGGTKTRIGCPEIIKTISLHPDGRIGACCGHAVFYSPHLTLGYLTREPLAEIVARAQNNVTYWWIHTKGPRRILEHLGIDGQYHSICHACQALFTEHAEKLRACISENKQEIIEDILDPQNFRAYLEVIRENKESIAKALGIKL